MLGSLRTTALSMAVALWVAGLTTCVGAQSPASRMADRWQQQDQDGDGVITRDEFSGPANLFQRWDTNRDQKLDQQEQKSAQQSAMDRMQKRRNRSGAQREAGNRQQGRKAMEDQVQRRGLQLGDSVPEATIYDAQGQSIRLGELWKDRPLMLVTGSITCPIAVDSCPDLSVLELQFPEQIRPVILYVQEAHPAASGKDFSDNQKTGRNSYPQPTTLSDRQTLAARFHERFGDPVPVYTAGMDGKLVQQLGTGPNSALLIGTDGKLSMKQGWFDVDQAKQQIEKVLGKTK